MKTKKHTLILAAFLLTGAAAFGLVNFTHAAVPASPIEIDNDVPPHSEQDNLPPHTKLVAGDPAQNEFYILNENAPLPVKISTQPAVKKAVPAAFNHAAAKAAVTVERLAMNKTVKQNYAKAEKIKVHGLKQKQTNPERIHHSLQAKAKTHPWQKQRSHLSLKKTADKQSIKNKMKKITLKQTKKKTPAAKLADNLNPKPKTQTEKIRHKQII